MIKRRLRAITLRRAKERNKYHTGKLELNSSNIYMDGG